MLQPFTRYLRAIAMATVCLLAGVTPPVWATLSVSPLRIFFTPKDRIVTVSISNDSARDMTVQVEAFRWSQGTGGDALEPTNEIVASPPLLKLAPGTRKVIRLARLRRGTPEEEQSYRLFVSELPPAESADAQAVSVRFSFSLSIPVFVTAQVPARDLRCLIDVAASAVECRNHGNTFVRVREITLQQGAVAIATATPNEYLLPGAAKAMPLKGQARAVAGPAQLRIQLEDGTTQVVDTVHP